MLNKLTLFNELIGLEDKKSLNTIKREAVRAIFIKNEDILLITSEKGDYKLPGGGVEKGEMREEALKREVLEETGYKFSDIKEFIEVVIERKIDKFHTDKIFEMTSYYYICEVSDHMNLSPENYEMEQGYFPVWIGIEEAIEKNKLLQYKLQTNDTWIKRENFVLNKLKLDDLDKLGRQYHGD